MNRYTLKALTLARRHARNRRSLGRHRSGAAPNWYLPTVVPADERHVRGAIVAITASLQVVIASDYNSDNIYRISIAVAVGVRNAGTPVVASVGEKHEWGPQSWKVLSGRGNESVGVLKDQSLAPSAGARSAGLHRPFGPRCYTQY